MHMARVWDYDLRNAWRVSFDGATRDFWIGDVHHVNEGPTARPTGHWLRRPMNLGSGPRRGVSSLARSNLRRRKPDIREILRPGRQSEKLRSSRWLSEVTVLGKSNRLVASPQPEVAACRRATNRSRQTPWPTQQDDDTRYTRGTGHQPGVSERSERLRLAATVTDGGISGLGERRYLGMVLTHRDCHWDAAGGQLS